MHAAFTFTTSLVFRHEIARRCFRNSGVFAERVNENWAGLRTLPKQMHEFSRLFDACSRNASSHTFGAIFFVFCTSQRRLSAVSHTRCQPHCARTRRSDVPSVSRLVRLLVAQRAHTNSCDLVQSDERRQASRSSRSFPQCKFRDDIVVVGWPRWYFSATIGVGCWQLCKQFRNRIFIVCNMPNWSTSFLKASATTDRVHT